MRGKNLAWLIIMAILIGYLFLGCSQDNGPTYTVTLVPSGVKFENVTEVYQYTSGQITFKTAEGHAVSVNSGYILKDNSCETP